MVINDAATIEHVSRSGKWQILITSNAVSPNLILPISIIPNLKANFKTSKYSIGTFKKYLTKF